MTTYRRYISRLFATLLFVGTAIPLCAQTHYDSRVYVGGKVGGDISQVFFYPKVKQGFKPGATVGARVRYVEESHFGLVAELNFVQRGWTESFEKGEDFKFSRTLNYMEIPVMAHVFFGRRGRFFFNAGPQVALLLNNTVSANFNTEDPIASGFPKNRRTAQITGKPQNMIDYGICASVGGEFYVTPQHSVDLEMRFYYGLGNIYSAKRTDVFSGSNQMTLSFTAGYWFRVK